MKVEPIMKKVIDRINTVVISVFILVVSCSISNVHATEQVVNLVVSYKIVNFTGKMRKAIAVNDQIPAPILHFKEGDHVTIHVYNHLDEETAIHWHGMMVPWQMDGVLGVAQSGIPPGGVFHYQFTIHQAGTYWYHAHAGLQEQQGLYGAFLVDPPKSPSYHYTKDYVVVLSDWSNTHPKQILYNLKKEGDYYSPRFPLQPSLVKFMHDYKKATAKERVRIVDDYKMMQQMRMSIYDISDVAYDAFLLNGRPKSRPWTAPVKIGDIVRLRFIGAGGSTIFKVKIPGTTMQVVHVQGNDVKPYVVDDLKIALGETYDVLVKIQTMNPYIIYAESIDTLGAAVGALVTKPHQVVNYQQVAPFPEPLPVMRRMMSLMMKGSSSMPMNHHSMRMPTEPAIKDDTISTSPVVSKTIGTKYQHLTAAVVTNDANKPVNGVIKMELFGYMGQYIWFVNGVPGYNAHPISLEPNKRYRFFFTNSSMMRHPMHIHGHWFILRNGHGSYDPLLHTLDIPPGATVTADVDTDASGQWFFHCHLLYHMMAGMSRVFQYTTLIDITKGTAQSEHIVKDTLYVNRPIVRVDEKKTIDPMLVHHPMPHPMGLWHATFLDIGADPFNNVQRLTYKGLYGSDYNKLELFTNDAEITKGQVDNADIDIFYWHLMKQFWAVKGGVNYFNQPASTPYWQPGVGIEGLMPYFIDTDIRAYYYGGSAKLDIELSRDTQITNNFLIRTGIRSILASKTVIHAAIGNGLNQMRYIVRPYYRVAPGLNISVEYEYQQGFGTFKTLQMNLDQPVNQNTLTLGFSVLL